MAFHRTPRIGHRPGVRVRPVVLLLALLLPAAMPAPARAQDAVAAARALLVAWHEEPARIDRARALLESAATPPPGAPPPSVDVLIELARVWFLTGDFRARREADRAAAYGSGADVARRAIAAAPREDRGHLWLAINTGRAAEVRGVMRALPLVNTVREASDAVLRLNPDNSQGLVLAGGLAAEMPGFMGGDRVKAEALFKRALEVDPHLTGGRLELARLYIATRRYREADRELRRVLGETMPTDLPRWTATERMRARALLADLQERGRVPAVPAPEAP